MMAGTLQTLGFRPPVAAGSGIPCRRILSFPATRVRPHGDFLSPVAPPSLTGKPLKFLRLVTAGSDQVDASGNHDSNSREDFLWVRPFLDFAATNIIPIALLSGIMLGLANPTLGCIAHRYSVAKFSTIGIFFISGLTLRSREIGAATEAWPAGMFGLKTLPVMVAVLEQLKGLGESGLLVLPCVASHIIQIIIDSFLVNVWLRKDRLSTEAKEA